MGEQLGPEYPHIHGEDVEHLIAAIRDQLPTGAAEELERVLRRAQRTEHAVLDLQTDMIVRTSLQRLASMIHFDRLLG